MLRSSLRRSARSAWLAALAFVWPAAVAAAAPIDGAELPPPATLTVDFNAHIKPLLETACLECHARGHRRGGFSIETRDEFLAGGESGLFVVVGDSVKSRLVHVVAATDDELFMPEEGDSLTEEQVGLLRAWIDQGLAWPEGFSFGFPRMPLAARRPKLPPAAEASSTHPIDRLLAPYFAGHGVARGELADDRTFMRRASLDLVGLLPEADAIDAFVLDARPNKRQRLVMRLLGDRQAYAEHWLTFWNDLLRNDYQGTGFIDGGRKQITAWLYRALYDDMPYDQFVRALVSPVEGSAGFTHGIVWRGVVNASQRPEMQAAQNIGQVFLGTNLKCASCHDSFVNQWKLADAYALASVFAAEPLDIHRCDVATGERSNVAFLFHELGSIDAAAPRDERVRRLAELLTSRGNGRLSRTMVNRLWAVFFGRGLVEPLDDLDQPPWHADLLDWLAADLADHGYDLKRTMRLICTSRAYQMPAVGAPPPEDRTAAVFHGPLVRRMTAEQYLDALAALTGRGEPVSDRMLKLDGRGQGGQVAAALAVQLGRSPDDFAPKKGERPSADCPASVRASLATASALATALGRSNREQVVTRRDSVATTLQAVELTNGLELDGLLKQAASRQIELLSGVPSEAQSAAVVDQVFRTALGRLPTAGEREAAAELVGDTPTHESVADLVWSVVMLPEFQLIY